MPQKQTLEERVIELEDAVLAWDTASMRNFVAVNEHLKKLARKIRKRRKVTQNG